MQQKQKLTVYTVLVGAKEALHDPLCLLPRGLDRHSTDLDIDWVCLSDNPHLQSNIWRIQPLENTRHLQAEKLSRRPKAMPHEYFPGSDYSLYVDNTVSFLRLPQASDLQHEGGMLFRAFQHATRKTPEEEASVVACLGYDDIQVVCGQMEFYASRRKPSEITPLTTGTVLLRSHHHAAIKRFGTLWWESILAFSKRDQLSLDFARQEAGVTIDYWPGSTDNNAFIHWNGSLGNQRVQASFDAKRYAWLHRNEEAAVRDPKAHALAAGHPTDARWQRDMPRLEYACHLSGSSLGNQVSPRRAVAAMLQPLLDEALMRWPQGGMRFLLVRVQDSSCAQAFSAKELEAATGALSIHLARGVGTVLDITAEELAHTAKVYSTDQERYDLVIVLGAQGEQFEAAAQKLIRLAKPEAGALLVVLTSPAPLQGAARTETLVYTLFGAATQTGLHSTRHDDLSSPLPNTLVATTWERVKVMPEASAKKKELQS